MLRSINRRPLLHALTFGLPTALVLGIVANSVGADLALLYVMPATFAISVVFAVVAYYGSRVLNRFLGLDVWF